MSLLLALTMQVVVSPTAHCTGARRNEVCTETGRAELRQQLGLQPLEVETAQGVEVYRAFYLEGGGARPAVAFVRRPGQNPSVEVTAGVGSLMHADVPLEVWSQVQAAGQVADLAVVPRQGAESACMDGGAVFAEIGLPAANSRSPTINRQRAASSCQDSGTLFFSRLLAQLAEQLLPGCAAIPRDFLSDAVTRLHYCRRLTGDQIAAAEVMGLAHRETSVREDDSLARKRVEWARATGVNPWTRLRWAGEDVPPNPGGRDAGGATDFLIARSEEAPSLRFHPVAFNGVSATVVEVSGHASKSAEPNSGSLYANYRQVWRRTAGQEWRVTEWSVEQFAPVL